MNKSTKPVKNEQKGVLNEFLSATQFSLYKNQEAYYEWEMVLLSKIMA